MAQWLVIGISGVTCGGKSTLANNLRDYFQSQQNSLLWNSLYVVGDVQLFNQDDYFLPVDDLRHKWIDKINAINFELLTSLDMKQMLSDITWTMKGRYLAMDPIENIDYMNEISMSISFDHHSPPHHHQYNHLQHQHHHQQHWQRPHKHQSHLQHYNSIQQHHHPLQLQLRQNNLVRVNLQQRETKLNILIIEGFMIFNQPELLQMCQLKFHFHLPYEKCFARRKKRSYDPPDVTGYFEICVWPMYEKNFCEFRDRKDITMLNGEVNTEQIFKFVLNRIGKYFDELKSEACPTPTNLGGVAIGNGSCAMDHQ